MTAHLSLAATRDYVRVKHAGQVDKVERDYFIGHLTPIAGALAILGEQATKAGLGHDIIEDPRIPAVQLLADGWDPYVVEAIVSVTRVGNEPYRNLILRAKAHPLGRWVKIVDNRWNWLGNDDVRATDPKAADRLLTKYEEAFELLVDGFSPEEMRTVALLVERLEAFRAHLDADQKCGCPSCD